MKTLIIWLAFLCYLSLMPTQEAAFEIPHLDKAAHFLLYAVTCALFFVVLKEKKRFVSLGVGRLLLLSAVLASGYGLSMEVAQAVFTQTRQFSLLDAAANALGAAVAAVYISRRGIGPREKGG